MYCAYVTRIHNLRKHTNADRLLCGECFGNTVIVDLGTDPDQLGVYFPIWIRCLFRSTSTPMRCCKRLPLKFSNDPS